MTLYFYNGRKKMNEEYEENKEVNEECEENKEMRIFRSRIDDGYMWVNIPAPEKGKTLNQRVTLENEIPGGMWKPTENRFIDFADIKPPTQEEMELVEEEIPISEGVYDKNGRLVFPGAKGKVPTLRIHKNTMAGYYYAPDREENKEMNEECEEESYRTIKTTWPSECSGCLYREREYIDEIDDYVECIHPIFSRQSYQCPVRMTARAKKKFGRTALDEYI